jgi:hypothetical protein
MSTTGNEITRHRGPDKEGRLLYLGTLVIWFQLKPQLLQVNNTVTHHLTMETHSEECIIR